MLWIKIAGYVALASPLLTGNAGQGRPATGSAQNSKVHDRNWLKSQVRRRYGTAALPEKPEPRKNPSVEKTSQPRAKN